MFLHMKMQNEDNDVTDTLVNWHYLTQPIFSNQHNKVGSNSKRSNNAIRESTSVCKEARKPKTLPLILYSHIFELQKYERIKIWIAWLFTASLWNTPTSYTKVVSQLYRGHLSPLCVQTWYNQKIIYFLPLFFSKVNI